jgi:hypothetical protein
METTMLVWERGDDTVGILDGVRIAGDWEEAGNNSLKLVIERGTDTVLEALILDTDNIHVMFRAVRDIIDFYHHNVRVHIAICDPNWVHSLDDVEATVWSISDGRGIHWYRGQYRYLLDWAGIASEY